jgi:hypothetical protein
VHREGEPPEEPLMNHLRPLTLLVFGSPSSEPGVAHALLGLGEARRGLAEMPGVECPFVFGRAGTPLYWEMLQSSVVIARGKIAAVKRVPVPVATEWYLLESNHWYFERPWGEGMPGVQLAVEQISHGLISVDDVRRIREEIAAKMAVPAHLLMAPERDGVPYPHECKVSFEPGKPMRALEDSRPTPATVKSPSSTAATCATCFGSGFVKGFGAPCPKGCKDVTRA